MRKTVGNGGLRCVVYESERAWPEELSLFALDTETGELVWGETFRDMDEAAQTWVGLLLQGFDPVKDGWIPSEGFEDEYRHCHDYFPIADSDCWDGIDGQLGISEPYLGGAGRRFAALCGLEAAVAEVLEEG